MKISQYESSQYWHSITLFFYFWAISRGGACKPLNDKTRKIKKSLIQLIVMMEHVQLDQ